MSRKRAIIILFLSFGIIGSYGFTYMKGTFYNVMQVALELSDVQLGKIWSVFGIVGMISYVGGGYFTDRFSPKKIITVALVISAVLHLYVSFVPSYPVILIISALMGISTVFAFFPASSKVLSFLGEDHNSGTVFGLYYALEGVGGMLINLTGTRMYMITGNELQTFALVVRLFALLNLLGAIGAYVGLSGIETSEIKGNVVSFKQLKYVFSQKKVWLIALITMCNYWLYCSLTYVTPYLTDLFKVSEDKAMLCGIIRVNVLALFAGLLFGRLADKKRSALDVIKIIMPLECLCSALILINQITVKSVLAAIILTMAFAFGTTGVKVISIVLISESDFPLIMTGTIIGVVSFIGYSPDAFLYPIAGSLMEGHEMQGYFYLFLISSIIAGIAVIGCWKLDRIRRCVNEKRDERVPDVSGV